MLVSDASFMLRVSISCASYLTWFVSSILMTSHSRSDSNSDIRAWFMAISSRRINLRLDFVFSNRFTGASDSCRFVRERFREFNLISVLSDYHLYTERDRRCLATSASELRSITDSYQIPEWYPTSDFGMRIVATTVSRVANAQISRVSRVSWF